MMHRATLHVYTVHLKPNALENQNEYPLFIKEGFSWPAFFLVLFWTLYHRLWLPSLLIGAYYLAIGVLQYHHIINHTSATILSFAMQALIGFQAGDWLREGLKKRGYVVAGIVTGDNLPRAEQRFFEQYLAEAK